MNLGQQTVVGCEVGVQVIETLGQTDSVYPVVILGLVCDAIPCSV